MTRANTVLLCSFFIIILLSCQEEQGNFTSVSQDNVYIFGIWKAPTRKITRETIKDVSANIQAQNESQSSHTSVQDKKTQQDGAAEDAYNTLPYLTTAAPETLLPKDGQVTDWVRVRKPTTYNPETLYKDRFVPPETIEIYRNYGIQRQAAVEYQSSKHGSIPYILFEIFDMGTPENAFGIFSVNSYPQPKYEWVGCRAIISGKYLWFWKGKHFIQIEGYGIATPIREAMIALAKVTAKNIQDPPQKIPLLQLLPQYIHGSEKLFTTNLTLHQVCKGTPGIIPLLTDGTIGVLAQYKNTRSKKAANPYTVFLIRFPTVDAAQLAYTQYRDALSAVDLPFKTDSQNGAILIDEQFGEP